MAYIEVERTQIASFLNTTPDAVSPTWKILGVGITDYGQTYSANKTTEKWIINKNATTTIDSVAISGDVSQKCYFGDEVYDFVNAIRREIKIGDDAKSQILDIDKYDVVSAGTYKATLYDCVISITSYATGEKPMIEYTIDYNGDVTLGVVTITGGVPTFVAETSSL